MSIPSIKQDLLNEFSDLAKALLGLDKNQNKRVFKAHIYRVGVTNAADSGLDMWANFGIAIQIKHRKRQNYLVSVTHHSIDSLTEIIEKIILKNLVLRVIPDPDQSCQ
jgi:type II restriction enzyme